MSDKKIDNRGHKTESFQVLKISYELQYVPQSQYYFKRIIYKLNTDMYVATVFKTKRKQQIVWFVVSPGYRILDFEQVARRSMKKDK